METRPIPSYEFAPFIAIKVFNTLNDYGVAITALATLFIAGFTGTLWRATSEQGRLTQQSIDLARDEFISTQRPKVRVRQICMWPRSNLESFMNAEQFKFIAGERLDGQYELVNVGATKATVEFICHIFYWQESSLPMFKPYDKLAILQQEPPITLQGGQRFTMSGLTGGPLDEDVIQRINTGVIKFYAMGWVRYRDDRMVIRETRFCRLWDAPECRFRAIENSDYEYSD